MSEKSAINQEIINRANQIGAAAGMTDAAGPLFNTAMILGYRQRVAQEILELPAPDKLTNLQEIFDDCNNKIKLILAL